MISYHLLPPAVSLISLIKTGNSPLMSQLLLHRGRRGRARGSSIGSTRPSCRRLALGGGVLQEMRHALRECRWDRVVPAARFSGRWEEVGTEVRGLRRSGGK